MSEDPRELFRQRIAQPTSGDIARQKLKAWQAEQAEIAGEGNVWSPFGTFLVGLLKGTGDAVLATPSATGDLLAMGAAGLEGTMRGLTPGGEGFDYRRRYQEEQQKFPASLIRSIPRPTVNDVVAGVRSTPLPPLPRPTVTPMMPSNVRPFDIELAALESADDQRATEHPIAAGLGEFGGTVASLLLTKQPLQNTVRHFERRLTTRPDMFFGAAQPARVTPGVSRLADRALKSHGARLAARGGFRAAETGLEAAYLEVLSEAENDPMLAAGLAAGGQIGASTTTQGLKSLLSGGPTTAGVKLGVAAFGTWSLWQIAKSATPGGRDSVIDSIETGYDKVAYAVMLGALGGLVGGRLRDAKIAEDLPNFVEALSTIPRAGVLSLITEYADAPEEEQKLFGAALETLQADPSYVGESDQERQIVQRLKQQLGATDE